MKIFTLIFFLAIVNFLLSQNTTESKKTTSKVDKAIHAIFQIDSAISTEKVYDDYDEEQSKRKIVFRLTNNGNNIGFLVFSKAKGRFDYFEYFVLIDYSQKIKYVEIYNYISEHGYQICNKKWLSQFNDFTVDSKFEYNNEISAISGATISGNSIVSDIKDILKLVNDLK